MPAIVAALIALPAISFAQTQVLIVSGLGGQPQYTKAFGDLSTALAAAINQRAGVPEAAIGWFGDSAAPRSKWFRGISQKENVERALTQLAGRQDLDQFVVVLIGHGAGEGAETRISLPGPDMTAKDFARLLEPLKGKRVALVNLTSASGDMLPLLTAPNRVVITATKSAFERNESQFGLFFVGAFAKDGADADKDNRISLLEAFRYAETETKRFYEDAGRLATEHPQIADHDELARRFFMTPASTQTVVAARTSSDPRLNALYAERTELDVQIQALKTRKPAMTADAYERDLERLLVALALKAREIRRAEGGS